MRWHKAITESHLISFFFFFFADLVPGKWHFLSRSPSTNQKHCVVRHTVKFKFHIAAANGTEQSYLIKSSNKLTACGFNSENSANVTVYF